MPADLEVGEVLEDLFRLDAQIGQGGMGRVFRATDLKLGRSVAVKALLAVSLDTETIRRFERETHVMSQLEHPGVVTLYSYGRERGVPWLAMQLLEGGDLWRALKERGGRMTPDEVLPIARQVLKALAYVHGRGLLHRDLKPSNIHVSPEGRVTLCDFGLARGHRSDLTTTGVVWGTPEYMAPEQIVGERKLDGRVDLYSLSVVIWVLLTGRPVFENVTGNEVLKAHLTRERPDVRVRLPSASEALAGFLRRGLAIAPDDRFRDADEMLAALEEAVTAERSPTSQRTRLVPHPQLAPTVKDLTAVPTAPIPSGERPTVQTVPHTERLAAPHRKWLPLAAAGIALVLFALGVAMTRWW